MLWNILFAKFDGREFVTNKVAEVLAHEVNEKKLWYEIQNFKSFISRFLFTYNVALLLFYGFELENFTWNYKS